MAEPKKPTLPAGTAAKSWLKRLGIVFAVFLFMALCILGALLMTLNTGWGRSQLTAMVDDIEGVDLAGIDGNLFGEMTLTGLALTDQDGVWLSIPETRISWSAWSLLQRQLTLKNVQIPLITVLRPPVASDPEPDAAPFELTDITDQPVSVALQNLEIQTIVWEAASGRRDSIAAAATGALKRGESLEIAAALVPMSKGVPDEINADLVLNTKAPFASTDITLNASADGLLASLLGLPGETIASIKGEGSPTAWAGSLKADISDRSIADVVAEYAAPRGSAKGTLFLNPFIDPAATDMLQTPFELAAQFEKADDDGFELDVAIENEAITTSLKGIIAAVDRRPTARDLILTTKVNGNAGTAQIEDLDSQIKLNGDTADITAVMSLKLAALRSGEITVSNSTFESQIRQSTGDLTAALSGKVGAVKGVDAITDARVLEDITLSLDLLRSADGQINAAAEARNGFLNLTGKDVSQAPNGVLQAKLNAGLADLQSLPGAIDASAKARAVIKRSAEGALNIAASAALTPKQNSAHWIAALATDTLALSSNVRLDGDTLSMDDIAVRSDRMDANGRIRLIDTSVTAAIAGKLNAEALEALTGSPVGGEPATFDITADGPVETVLPRGYIKIPGYNAAGLALRDVVLQLSRGPAASPSATRLALDGRSSAGPVRASALLKRFAGGAVSVDALDARLANVTANGAFELSAKGEPSGAATVTLVPLTYAQSGLFGLSGEAKIDAAFSRGSQAALTFDGEGSRITYGPRSEPIAQLAALTLKGSLDLSNETPSLIANLDAKAIEAAGVFFDQVLVNASSDEVAQTVQLTLQQQGARPTNAVLDVSLETKDDATLIAVMPSGDIAAQPFTSDAPLQLTFTSDGMSLAPATITVGGGTVLLKARQSPQELAADASFEGLQLRTVTDILQQPTYSATVAGSLTVKSQPKDGSLDAQIDIKDLAAAEQSATPISLTMSAQAQAQTLNTRISVSHAQSPDALRAQAALPIRWPQAPGLFTLNTTDPVAGTLTLDTQLAPLWQLVDQVDQTLQGALNAEMTLSGSLNDIKPTGTIALSDGRYENLELGTQLNSLTAAATLTDTQLLVQSLSANDGRGGTLSASAVAGLYPFEPQQSKILLQDFQLLAKEGLVARADADLALTGSAEALSVAGDVTIAEARYAISTSGAAAVPTLPIEEINKAALDGDEPGTLVVKPRDEEAAKDGALPPINLDIQVNAPRRIFVTGMGLTSEWRTQLDIDGTAQKPSVVGQIQMIRGELEFAGKRFQLERGQIFLDGGQEIEPRLDILAQNTQGDFTARIGITGTPSDPVITLSSSPALPDDEILSRILFGTSASDLSALEAVQLGSAVAALSSGGGSSALDIAGKARSATGLDRLSLGSNDSSTAITGGKYLSPNVYLQFTTDPGSGQYLAAIEWYITRTLSLLSEYGAETGSNVAGRWSRTY
jgi:translocation and assembly module TamB